MILREPSEQGEEISNSNHVRNPFDIKTKMESMIGGYDEMACIYPDNAIIQKFTIHSSADDSANSMYSVYKQT
jgi:hypothetical protein